MRIINNYNRTGRKEDNGMWIYIPYDSKRGGGACISPSHTNHALYKNTQLF